MARALLAREIRTDYMAMRTSIAVIANAGARKPAIKFGYAPDKQGHVRMATGSELSPKIRVAVHYLIKNYFQRENLVAPRLAECYTLSLFPTCRQLRISSLRQRRVPRVPLQ